MPLPDGVIFANPNLGIERHRKNLPHWQQEQAAYFLIDRFIRDEGHFWKCARYVRHNPAKAKLRAGEYRLHEAEAVAQHLDAAGVTRE